MFAYPGPWCVGNGFEECVQDLARNAWWWGRWRCLGAGVGDLGRTWGPPVRVVAEIRPPQAST